MPALPKDPATRSRGRKSTTAAKLTPVDNPTIPELPPASEWIEGSAWPAPVTSWWSAVWSSPMSSEYDDSDLPGLHMAAMYLALATDQKIRPSERLKAASQHEAAVKNYGLTPMSRRSLQWEILKTDDAQARAARGSNKPTDGTGTTNQPRRPDPREAVEDESNPFAERRRARESGR